MKALAFYVIFQNFITDVKFIFDFSQNFKYKPAPDNLYKKAWNGLLQVNNFQNKILCLNNFQNKILC